VRFLLDTNICIYIAKRRPPQVADRFEALQPGDVGMSVVTYAELLFGVNKSQNRDTTRERLERFVEFVPVLSLPDDAAEHYARVRYQLERGGTPIGGNDLWIASHALASRLTLVSNNLKEFDRVEGLVTENWAH
jgi:tRNA(fMet)-specific endonuclease VapC